MKQVDAAMTHEPRTLLDLYRERFPDDGETLRRAWRVCYAFDRFDLFDSLLGDALEKGRQADWVSVFELARDAAIEP